MCDAVNIRGVSTSVLRGRRHQETCQREKEGRQVRGVQTVMPRNTQAGWHRMVSGRDIKPLDTRSHNVRVHHRTRRQRFERDGRKRPEPVIVDVIRLGRITALQKLTGGVRGIVVGDILRRLVSIRTIAQQMSDVVEAATALYQHALSTRVGTECIAHILQTLTEDDPRTTVLSIDGIGTFDLISRKSMLEALMTVEGGPDIMPFVRQFHGQPSTFLWETTSPYTRSNRVKGANKVTH